MRKVLLASAAASLALAGCGERSIRISKRADTDDGGAFRVVTQLECPDHQGPLTRVRTAPDGLSCDYAGPRGADVSLRLIKFDGDAEAALAPIDREVDGLMPQVMTKIAEGEARSRAADAAEEAADRKSEAADRAAERADAEAERAAARAEAKAERDAAQADRDADSATGDSANVDLPGLKVKSRGDTAKVDMPGLHVDADDSGARVNIPGIHINAKDKSGVVNITSGGDKVDIRAEDDAAQIRTRKAGDGVRVSYILVDKRPSSQGWRVVGYEARGPAKGPIVAAVVKSKERHEDAVFDAAKQLVRRNVGG